MNAAPFRLPVRRSIGTALLDLVDRNPVQALAVFVAVVAGLLAALVLR